MRNWQTGKDEKNQRNITGINEMNLAFKDLIFKENKIVKKMNKGKGKRNIVNILEKKKNINCPSGQERASSQICSKLLLYACDRMTPTFVKSIRFLV